MRFIDKLRRLVSNKPDEASINKLQSHLDPKLSSPYHEPLSSDLHKQSEDPFLRTSQREPKEVDYITPVLDGEWELYEPAKYNLEKESTKKNQRPRVSDQEIDSHWQQEYDLGTYSRASVNSSSLDQVSSKLAQSESSLGQSEVLSSGPYEFSVEDSSMLNSNSPMTPLPETEMIHQMEPPFIGDDHQSQQVNLLAQDSGLGLNSVFIANDQYQQSQPQLSQALLPVAVPNPLSYALVYRDHIEQRQKNIDIESQPDALLALLENYTNLVPNDISMWHIYSELLIENHGLEHAYDKVKLALGKTRDDTAHLFMLADMSQRMCDTHTAMHYISVLNDMHPNNIEVLERLRDIQRECKFFEFADNTDAHIKWLYDQQQKQQHLDSIEQFPFDDH